MEHLIIGTAGHVDHGKTALIKALTGLETDRLKEEKKRGISIELGFAFIELPDGSKAGIIDVPGHERFIKNMLAGAAGIDLCLLVVAADEGVMPQTREHVAILELLDTPKGIVVFTKKDSVDVEWMDFIQENTREFLADTFLKDAPFVAVSSITGDGIAGLKELIYSQISKTDIKRDMQNIFFPIDRVFSMPGFGTIVTGTLHSGVIAVEDRLEVMPQETNVRIRSIQIHGASCTEALPGQRVALNLAGIDHNELKRGAVISKPGFLKPTNLIDVELKLLPSANKSLFNSNRIRFHVGTIEVLGRVRLLSSDELEAGQDGIAQIFLEEPVVVMQGSRYVIRSYSPMETIGGGRVINPLSKRHKRFNDEVLDKLRVLAGNDKVSIILDRFYDEIIIDINKDTDNKPVYDELLNNGEIIFLAEGFCMRSDVFLEKKSKLLAFVNEYHQRHPLQRGADREYLRKMLFKTLGIKPFQAILAYLQKTEEIKNERQYVFLPDHNIAFTGEYQRIREIIEKAIKNNGFQPPSKEEILGSLSVDKGCFEEVWQALLDMKIIYDIGGNSFHYEQIQKIKEILLKHFASENEISLAQVRDYLESTRKYVLPLLEYFDSEKLTLRKGDVRVRGALLK